MGPNACGTGRPVLRPPGGGSGALGVGLALVAVLYGSSAVPLGDGQVRALRQSEMTTESTAMNVSAPDVWWWVFLIVLVVVAGAIAVTCLLACCIIRWSRRHTRPLEAIHLNYQMCSDTHLMSHSESPQKFSTSGHSSSPLGMGDHSSQISSSSLLLAEKGKWRRPSPGHSSGSEEGFKPRGSRTSLASSHSSVHGVRLAGADSQSSVERLSSGRSGRRRSGAVVHVTKLCDDSNLSLVSAPSTASMQSAYSASHASDSSQPAAVEVNVTVGAESTGQDTQVTTAAALAESARQLAQSAAEFGEESDNMWEMYRKRSGAWQKRFVTIRNGGYSPATMHRLLSHHREGAPPSGECHLDMPSGLDSPDIVPSHGSSSPTHPFKLPPGRSYTNGTLPHLVPGLCGGASGSFTQEGENCGNSPGSPHLDRRFSYHSHLYNEGWERRWVCDPCESYSPPHMRSGPTSTHQRQVCQRNGSESVGRELKPIRRVWQDVEVPLNTTPSVVTDSSTESAPPSPTQSHGESTVNQSTINEEEVPQVRQPSGSRPKSAPAVAKTTSSKQGLSLSLQDTPTSPTTEKNHQSRRPSVHSLVVASFGVHAKEDVSPSRSASSGNLQPKGPLQISEQGIESETSYILFRLRRQTSVPNFRCSSHHPLLPSATTAGPDNHSSQSLARTSSAMSIGGVESAQSGYLASDGSSLTLDGEQDFVPSCGALRNGEWNVHVGSLLSPTSPLGNEIFDSMFEQHIRQYSNTSSASSANQPTGHRTVSPPLRTRELGMDRLYRALPRRSSGTAKKLISPPDYHPRWSTTSNEGVDV